MSKELKAYALKATKRPARNESLSTTAHVVGPDGKDYYCYVSFSPKLTHNIGKKMPQGVSPFDPAFLSIRYEHGHWVVYAKYARDGRETKMWCSPAQPHWLNFYIPKVHK